MLLLAVENIVVDQQDIYRQTPLHYAAKYGHMKALLLLTAAGADASKQDNNGFFPIHYAAQADRVDIVDHLLKQMDMRHIDKYQTLLHWAMRPHLCCFSEGKVAAYLLQHEQIRTLLNVQDISGNTPLHYAVDMLSFLKMLQPYSAVINADVPSSCGHTPLQQAIFFKKHKSIKRLLKYFNVDVNKAYANGNTPLHMLAARVGSLGESTGLEQNILATTALLLLTSVSD